MTRLVGAAVAIVVSLLFTAAPAFSDSYDHASTTSATRLPGLGDVPLPPPPQLPPLGEGNWP